MNNIDSNNLKKCIACFEDINFKALTCPHCHSPQQHTKLKAMGDVLKWIGGITAVLSLIIVITQVNSIYKSWYETELFVEQLVNAAEARESFGDIDSAYTMITEALEHKPTSYKAREKQLKLAMKKLRRIYSFRTPETHEQVPDLLSVLYQGISISDKLEADIYAHIGWGNGLISDFKNTDLNVDAYFNHALKLDNKNLFANAMLARWILDVHTNNKKSQWYLMSKDKLLKEMSALFETSFNSGLEHEYLRQLQLTTYRKAFSHSVFAKAYITTVITMIKNNESIPDNHKYNIDKFYYKAFYDESFYKDNSVLNAIIFSLPEDDLKTITKLLISIKPYIKSQNIIFPSTFAARISENNTEYEKSLLQYRDTYHKLYNISKHHSFLSYLTKSIIRVCDNYIAQPNKNNVCKEFSDL